METRRGKKTVKGVESDTEVLLEDEKTSEDILSKINEILLLQQNQDKKTTQILSKIESLEEKWEQLNKTTEEHSKAIDLHETEISEMKESMKEYIHRKEFEVLKAKGQDLENRSRRNNLVLWNFPEHVEDGYESCAKFVEDFIVNHMKCTEMDGLVVERAHRTRIKVGKPRPIHARILNWRHKEQILHSGKLLKNNPYDSQKIFITDDVSREVREERALLRQHLEEIRAKEDVLYAYIPWVVPAKIVYKLTDNSFKSVSVTDFKK